MAAHVLLVEDELSIAEAMRFLLQRDGLRVSTLIDGREVAPFVRATPPDLIILDMMLPGMSGLDVLAGLRAEAATGRESRPGSGDGDRVGHVPVLMLTAKGHPQDREAAERAGADRFLTKPFANAEMLAEVHALLKGSRDGA
jgi:DNA-binding response OmpR family regulator